MIPMITMGLFSEEKKRGTIELLLTTPLTNLQVVLGKFFAGLTFFCCMLGLSMLLIGTLFIYSKPDFGPIFSGYLGLLLYGASLVALGMFVSTLTENQIIAAVLGFGMILILCIVDAFAGSTGTVMQHVISYLSVIQHLEDFIKGVVDTPGIIFYISLAIFGIVLTYRSVESYRWRG
jgi:ABC-2 type transport system permease protein